MKKKILVYSETFLPDLGGLERNTLTLCTNLSQLGYNVELLTATLEEDNVYPFPVIRTKRELEIIKKIRKADLIFVNGGVSLKITVPAVLMGKKYVLIYQMATLHHWPNPGIKGAVKRQLLFFFASKAKVNVGVSPTAIDELKMLKPAIPSILVNPIDNELELLVQSLQTTKNEKKFDLIFAGRVIDGKGVFLLAKAIKAINASEKISCAIAGEGSDLQQLKIYCNDNQLPVTFLGRLDRASLLKAYQNSRILVIPSTTHTEGSPLVIAESITVGTPVLVSDQKAMVDAVGKAGIAFASNNLEDFILKIKQFLWDGSSLTNKESSCKMEKMKFSVQAYRDALAKIIDTAFS